MAWTTKKQKRTRLSELRDVDRAFINAVMFESGILPMENSHLDMRRALSQLSREEARALKRKFRKLWRKAARAKVNEVLKQSGTSASETASIGLTHRLGVGKTTPSRDEKTARKDMVCDMMWEKYIVPLLERFENPDRERMAKGTSA